jgi:thiol-disulfide isomerase/thioredoxin
VSLPGLKYFAAVSLLISLLLINAGCTRSIELPWGSDLAAAKVRAKQEGKNLIIDFTGSTWCGPCKQLGRGVFATREFAAFSKDVVLVSLDFPPEDQRRPENIQADPKLAALMAAKQEYGVAAFPTVILLSPDEREIGRAIGYGGEAPNDYLRRLGAAVPQPPM